MTSAPIPLNEEERLAKLRQYGILDTATEQDYDDIARLVTEICNTPLSTISFVDRDRQWFKAAVGITDRETSRNVAFCAHTILGDDLFTVEDASRDSRFDDNPLVTLDPQLRFYAGMPLVTPDGFRLGALCAIDRVPRTLTPRQEESLRVLARHVVNLLELRYSRQQMEMQNRELQELSDLKSRLMSIIAHDLRSPMASIHSIMSLFSSDSIQPEKQQELLVELGKVLDSTRFLLDNVIGWAARSLDTTPFEISPIELKVLARELVVSLEHDVTKKGNRLEVEMISAGADTRPLKSDRNILVFVVRNLLANANKFTRDGTITLRIDRTGDGAIIEVADTGIGMTAGQQERLFEWTTRSHSTGTDGEKGTGLALLFCHDFVGRLGGSLTVRSAPGSGTTMRVTIPDAD